MLALLFHWMIYQVFSNAAGVGQPEHMQISHGNTDSCRPVRGVPKDKKGAKQSVSIVNCDQILHPECSLLFSAIIKLTHYLRRQELSASVLVWHPSVGTGMT